MRHLITSAVTCVFIMYTALVEARSFPDFPAADFMQLTLVAEDMQFNGVPMRLIEFKTGANRERVIGFYRTKWGEDLAETKLGEADILSHRDGDYLLTVQINPGHGLETSGTLSTAPLFDNKARSRSALGKGFPMPSGTTVVNDIVATDGPKKSRTLLLKTTKSLRQTYDFYSRRFEQEGWKPLAPDANKQPEPHENMGLILGRKGDELNLAFVSGADGTVIVAVLVDI